MKIKRNLEQKIAEFKNSKFLFAYNLANDFTSTTLEFHNHNIHADILVELTGKQFDQLYHPQMGG